MGMENISHISTGVNGWTEDGLPLQEYDAWKAAKDAAQDA